LNRNLSTQVLVIGGGATGLGIAWDACLRGLKVVLVEQYDLGQGTSGRYHGLLHSGGRYVITDPLSAQECARENEILRRLAPAAIEDTGGYFVATPADPPDFPDRWLSACIELEVPANEITPDVARRSEPALSSRLSRVFQVRDATLDSFDLAHMLLDSIREAGGAVYLHHRTLSLRQEGDRVTGARVQNLRTGELLDIGAEIVVNAAGPWAAQIGQMAALEIPISLGKGTMLAIAVRPVNTVINRCTPPSDGDIIVPVGTVAVLGTTDVPVQNPEQLEIEAWEIDLLLAEAELSVPGISQMRPLRAWAGIRPLYQPPTSTSTSTRSLPRAFAVLDHEKMDGCAGLVSVIGGKLTTYRLMAEETVDLLCHYLDHPEPCRTAATPLAKSGHGYHVLTERLARTVQAEAELQDDLICECELITRSEVIGALENPDNVDFDSLRRDLRLGMGPCQAGFCAFRTAGLAAALAGSEDNLAAFLEERWRGIQPVCWGSSLREMELMRRIYLELLGIQAPEARP
jgi:glycerol-3-phosphate dehydrogenase